ncbi:MAG: lamin tail domain-containing protein, partial [Bacteroidota bacterium]
ILAGSPGLISSSFEITVRVTRDATGLWSLFVDSDAGEAFSFEASAVDDTYTSSEFLGVVCNYTVSNSTNFYYDDFFVGPEEIDEEPPTITNIQVVSGTELQLSFSEPVEELSAETVAFYSVSGLGNPSAAERSDVDQIIVDLTFATSFPENIEQTLSVEDVEDFAANPLALQEIPFTYVVSASAQVGDLVFNEILADPTPVLGLPEAEYLEIYNASSEFFDLADWVLVNTNTEKVLTAMPLPPNEYIILCDEENVEAFEGFGAVLGVPSFTALSNNGDSLTLRSPENTIVDIVVYDISWYGGGLLDDGGVSLERINPFGGCSGANNWSASQAFSGGTPGGQNTIFDDSPDTQAPEVVSFQLLDESTLEVVFDESLDFNAPAQVMWESSDINVLNITFGENGSVLIFSFDEDVIPGIAYSGSIDAAQDCEGNQLGEPFIVDFQIGFTPEPGDLIITEILADPDEDLDSPNDEFVEVYNTTDVPLELTNIQLVEGQFIGQVVIEPNSYLTICNVDNLSSFLLWPGTVGMESFPALTNGGRLLELFNGEGELLDAVNYNDSWYNDPDKDDGGYSLELINPELPCSDASNWTASQDPDGATPGLTNSVFDLSPDLTGPQIVKTLVVDPTTLQLFFNEPLLNNLQNLQVEVGIINPNYEPLTYTVDDVLLSTLEGDPYPKVLNIQFDQAFAPPLVYEIRVSGVADCSGNELVLPLFEADQFAIPELHEPGDVIINEVLFNPFDDGVDYVELWNISSKNINVEGWKLANTGEGDLITTEQRVLFAGEYLLVST